MARDEAKKRVRDYLNASPVDDEYPLTLAGEFIKKFINEDANHIWIEGNYYAEGENPKDEAVLYRVTKETGKVMLWINFK